MCVSSGSEGFSPPDAARQPTSTLLCTISPDARALLPNPAALKSRAGRFCTAGETRATGAAKYHTPAAGPASSERSPRHHAPDPHREPHVPSREDRQVRLRPLRGRKLLLENCYLSTPHTGQAPWGVAPRASCRPPYCAAEGLRPGRPHPPPSPSPPAGGVNCPPTTAECALSRTRGQRRPEAARPRDHWKLSRLPPRSQRPTDKEGQAGLPGDRGHVERGRGGCEASVGAEGGGGMTPQAGPAATPPAARPPTHGAVRNVAGRKISVSARTFPG